MVEYAIAIPVAVFLVLLWVLHARLVVAAASSARSRSLVAAGLVLLLPLASPAIGLEGTVVGIAVVAAALTGVTIVDRAYSSVT